MSRQTVSVLFRVCVLGVRVLCSVSPCHAHCVMEWCDCVCLSLTDHLSPPDFQSVCDLLAAQRPGCRCVHRCSVGGANNTQPESVSLSTGTQHS